MDGCRRTAGEATKIITGIQFFALILEVNYERPVEG